LHRPYRVTRVEVAAPNKLEDRVGGPADLQLRTAEKMGDWSESRGFDAMFSVALRNVTEPDTIRRSPYDKRHDRAWLSWSAELPDGKKSRWVQIDMNRVRKNSSLSLGEVVIWAIFEGEIQAAVRSGEKLLRIDTVGRWTVNLPDKNIE
jgi:hypothetical protein